MIKKSLFISAFAVTLLKNHIAVTSHHEPEQLETADRAHPNASQKQRDILELENLQREEAGFDKRYSGPLPASLAQYRIGVYSRIAELQEKLGLK